MDQSQTTRKPIPQYGSGAIMLAVACIAAVFLSVWLFRMAATASTLRSHETSTASGRVIEVNKGYKNCSVTIEFSDQSKTYRTDHSCPFGDRGDTVRVHYLPSDPTKNWVQNAEGTHPRAAPSPAGPIVGGSFAGAAALLLGFFTWLAFSAARTAEVAPPTRRKPS